MNGDHRDADSTRVLIAKITELEKVHEDILEAQYNVGANQWSRFLWSRFLWSQHKNTKKKFKFGDYVLWFCKGENKHMGKFKKRSFA